MRVFRVCRTALCASAVLVAMQGATASRLSAQTAAAAKTTAPVRTKGLMVGAHLVTGTTVSGRYGRAEDYIQSDRVTGVGAGAAIGWGFSKWFSLYAALDRAVTNVKGTSHCNVCDPLPGADPNAEVSAKFITWNPDFGAQINVPITRTALVPYARVAYTYRIAQDADRDRTFSGPAVTTGLGVQYFFAERFALDGALQFTTGSYTKLRTGNSTSTIANDWDKATQNSAARFSVGVKYFPLAGHDENVHTTCDSESVSAHHILLRRIRQYQCTCGVCTNRCR